MSRSGLNEADFDSTEDVLQYGRFRGQVSSAIKGKRGQQFFRAVIEALDAMPEKRLIRNPMNTADAGPDGDVEYDSLGDADGNVCVLGALAKHRGLPVLEFDAEDHDKLAETFNVAPQLAQEVMWMNDEYFDRGFTPEARWKNMREWAEKQLKKEAVSI